MNRQRRELSATQRVLGCIAIGTCAFLAMAAPAGAVVISDNFNANHDYTAGDTTGTIWTGMENIPLLVNQTVHDANTTNAGTLTVGDNGTYVSPGSPPLPPGMGWEGNRSTAPFLNLEVPAGKDFTATVKIVAQTAGNWSAAGLLARAPSATPPGVAADHADENFVTMAVFRTDAANVNEANTLMKRVLVGAQQEQNFPINPTGGATGNNEPNPLVVKLEKVGGGQTYRGWVSQDGGATYQFQSRVAIAAGNPLRDPLLVQQVGLHFQMYGGSYDHDMDPMTPNIPRPGEAQFDDFTIDTYDPLPAPGVPIIGSSQTSFTVPRGTVIAQLISDSSGQSGPHAWVRTPNLPGADAMIQGAQGGGSALLTLPATNQSYFRWDTLAPNGTYTVDITATNDWGQVSDQDPNTTGNQGLRLTITIIPEPATLTLAGLVMIGLVGWIRRRR